MTKRHRPEQCPEDESCNCCCDCYLRSGESRCAGCCPHAAENYPWEDDPAEADDDLCLKDELDAD